MTWSQLALNEWRRRPLRTVVTMAGVAIAVAALFSLLSFHRGYRIGINRELERLGAHVLVVPKGCPYDAASIALHGANWPCYLKENYLTEVRSVPAVATAAPCFMAAVYDTNGTQFVYEGVDSNILMLKTQWRIQGSFPRADGELMAGSEVARHYGWKVGDSIQLPCLASKPGKVCGILAPTFGAEDSFIFLRFEDAQDRFKHRGEMTHVLVRLKDPSDLDSAVAQLRGCEAGLSMNVIPLAHVYHTIQAVVNSTRLLLGCLALVALMVAATGVSNTMLMAVRERTREIGVMRAIGASRGDVFRLIWMQTIQLCIIGAMIGAFLAFAASGAVEGWVRSRLPFAPAGQLITWDWLIVAGCVAGAFVLGTFASFLPAWQAASVPPVRSIQSP